MLEILIPMVGCVAGSGIALFVLSLVRRVPRLDDALGCLSEQPVVVPAAVARGEGAVAGAGWWAYRRWPGIVRGSVRRQLVLTGRGEAEFVGEKLLLGIVGLGLPVVMGGLANLLGTTAPRALPAAASLLLGVAGFFWPDVALRRTQTRTGSDMREALLSFYDLVIIERLANRSATQAMASAASISELPVFVQLRAALDQARLEQRSPWPDLHALSEGLGLPEVADLADIMRLDEQGASLVGPMRARVGELRDAQLLRDKVAAQKLSESMTLWMVIPTAVFSLIVMVPPLLRLAGG